MILKVPVVDFLLAVDPEAGQLGQDIDDLEGLEVVDEDVGQPQVMDQLEINWKKEYLVSKVKRTKVDKKSLKTP